jgi:hypothetical protein
MSCRRWAYVVPAVALLALSAVAQAGAVEQTRPWRIGVSGSYCSGYWGMLGRLGLPRERLLEQRVWEADYLKQFDVVLMGSAWGDSYRTSRAVEQFVYGGGIAVTEYTVWPSPSVLPGDRYGDRRTPNMRFVESDCPASKGLPQLGIVYTSRRNGVSIFPTPGRPDTYEIARYTDRGAPSDVTGGFRTGSGDAPAMLLFRYGKGWWLWCGTQMSYQTALRDSEFVPAILNALDFASGGELRSIVATTSLGADQLLTAKDPIDVQVRRRPGRGDRKTPPSPFEVWDDDAEQSGDFDLTGTLRTGSSAEVVAAYWNPQSYRSVRFDTQEARILRVEGGQETTVASALLPSTSAKSRQVHVKRRHGQVFVRIDGVPLMSAVDGREQQGLVAAKGLDDVSCQPATPVDFSDDFMRLPQEQSDWEPVTGTWQVQQDRGDRNAGEVSMSANPFRYEASASGETEGRAVVGSWAWDDYEAEVSVRPTCATVGILGHYESPESYLALQVPVVKKGDKPGSVSLVVCSQGQRRVIATAQGACQWDEWTRLGLRISGGYVQALVDGEILAEALDPVRGVGRAGLTLTGGKALFDDVSVKAWEALPRPFGTTPSANWDADKGSYEVANGKTGEIEVRGKPEARILSPWMGRDAYRCWASLRPEKAQEAGLFLRYLGPRQYYLLGFSPAPEGQTLVRLTRVNRDTESTLGEATLTGGLAVERSVLAQFVGDHLQVWVDGEKHFDLADDGPIYGRLGMYSRGEGAAYFRNLGALPVDAEKHLVDDLTPSFAGILDRHTWAGKVNSLVSSPTDLRLFWHRGEFAGDVTVKIGVRQQKGEPVTVASALLGDGQATASGYEMRITRTWDLKDVKLEVFRLGQKVAEGTAPLFSTRTEFEAEMSRVGQTLVLRLDGEAVLRYRDDKPLDARHLGMRLAGSLLYPDDTRIETPAVRVDTFAEAATGWTSEAGTWEVSSRWSCTPGWTWFAGWGTSDVWTRTKDAFVGDQRIDMFVGCKMMDIPGNDRNKKEVLQELRLGMCTKPGDVNSGYRFILGGRNNTWTAIQKNGSTVAEVAWKVPQAGLHNDWTLMSAVKHGNVISLEWEGHEVLRYVDPEPLTEGHVSMGTYDNGIMVPKVTIYGQIKRPPVTMPALDSAAKEVVVSRKAG